MRVHHLVKLFLLAIVGLMLLPIVPAQAYFGQNKVQYREYDWYILPTRHFDVHFYTGQEELAYLTAEWAEQAHDHVAEILGHRLGKRIPLIVYGSHLDFQQTNVTYEFIEEGTQGFTEVLKNRMVIHFQGSFADYRHLITHEMVHAVMFDMIYNESFSPQQYLFHIPLWFAEGLAEYCSHFTDSWDPETEMFIRDAVLSESLVPITQLDYYGGYLIYKQGQSIVRFIAKQYGEEKLGEIIEHARVSRSFDQAINKALGVSIEQLSEDWERLQKRHYLPEFADLLTPEEVARQLTDHKKEQNYFHMRPVFSPDGNRIAFFSDRKMQTGIYVMSAHDGKEIDRLIDADPGGGYEQLHMFNSNLTWSPDSKRIAFVSKYEGRDHIFIHDAEKKERLRRLSFKFDSIQSPDWSPDGESMVFSAIFKGRRDLYLVNLETEQTIRLTNDRYDDQDPRWSPDGKRIVYASDRLPQVPDMTESVADSSAGEFQYNDYNITVYDVDTRQINLIVTTPGDDQMPVWSPTGEYVAYVSHYSGTPNIFIHSLKDSSNYRLTDITGGVTEIDWSSDGERLVFSAFQKWGWDLFLLEDPLNSKDLVSISEVERMSALDMAQALDTSFKKMYERREGKSPLAREREETKIISAPLLSKSTALDSIYVQKSQQMADSTVAEGENMLPEPEDKSQRKYVPTLSPDFVTGGLAYAYNYGFYGGTALYFSDILGDHNLQVLTNLNGSISETDILAMYYYLPKRIDYGIGVFHEKNNFVGFDYRGDFYYEQREYGVMGLVSYPFSRYERVDFSMMARGISSKYSDILYWDEDGLSEVYTDDQFLFQPSISLVKDTSIWGYTGPVGGTRAALTLSHSPGVFNERLEFTTGILDYRHYFRITRRHQIAFRSIFALSSGPFAERFRIGGAYTLRGYDDDDNDLVGSKIGFVNLEFRFPFIDQLFFRWPLPVFFQGIRGALFLDMGAAWDDTESFRGASYEGGNFRLHDIKASYGIGARVPIAFFILRFDLANKTNFDDYNSSGIFQFSIGTDF